MHLGVFALPELTANENKIPAFPGSVASYMVVTYFLFRAHKLPTNPVSGTEPSNKILLAVYLSQYILAFFWTPSS